ncbi:hypothetical protein TNCT_101441 [Trichonephila clavata]|uniref:Uncharacterized protein n=1 Tax=Trichonephila clavata TaxID=2740835 RepID=A0A8X6L657_TRICU|nr:hypothetical protein TNCT_101441 [Trichonephila clavata]
MSCLGGTNITLPPHMPGKRVAVRPSRMHQNVRSVGSESFKVGECRALAKRTLRYSAAYTAGRVAVRPTCIHQNSRLVDTEVCSEFFHRSVNVVPWRMNITLPTAYTGRTGRGKTSACMRTQGRWIQVLF